MSSGASTSSLSHSNFVVVVIVVVVCFELELQCLAVLCPNSIFRLLTSFVSSAELRCMPSTA